MSNRNWAKRKGKVFPQCAAAEPPYYLRSKTKPAIDPSPGRTDGRFLETCLRVLVDQLATAHRPTVPPSGERTVIVIIAIAVMLADHLFDLRALDPKSELDYSFGASASRTIGQGSGLI